MCNVYHLYLRVYDVIMFMSAMNNNANTIDTIMMGVWKYCMYEFQNKTNTITTATTQHNTTQQQQFFKNLLNTPLQITHI